MTEGRWTRFAPLTGALFVILVAAGFIVGGETPGTDDSAQKAVSFYTDHEARQFIAALLVIYGAVFLVFFGGTLRARLRTTELGAGRLSYIAFGGALLTAAGLLVAAGIHIALVDAADEKAVTPQAIQALTIADNDDWPLFAAGMGIMVLASGRAILRGGALLPRWLAWAGVVIGVLVFTPAGFFAFIACGLWVLVASVMLFTREDAVGPAVPDTPVAPGPAGAP